MRALSIDIGTKNMALYIEEFDIEKLHELTLPEQADRFDKNHLPTKEYKDVLKKVYKNGQCKFLDLVNLSGAKSGKVVTIDTLLNLTKYLEDHCELIDECSFVIIEEQMNSRIAKNTNAVRLQHHIHSWFVIKYGNFKPCIIFRSKFKSQVLGAPNKVLYEKGKNKGEYKKRNKNQLKKWSEKLGMSILNLRKDDNTLMYVTDSKKKDDVMDALVQFQSCKVKFFIEKSLK